MSRHRVLVGLVLGCLLALLGTARTGIAVDSPSVVLNELNCTGADWIEVMNRGSVDTSIGNWLLTDDPLDRVPLRASHRWRFPAGTVLGPGQYVVVTAGGSGFPFGLSCGDDILRLADQNDAPVDTFALPVLGDGSLTLGRIPDGTGDWTVTLPTPGAANAVGATGQGDDPAWLYDPLQVTQIDLEATPDALAQLAVVSDEYVPARITLRNGDNTYGPYLVGLKLKGHSAFRTLDGKAAFKVKFGFSVSGQRFFGLKTLTLNNMVQDPSMLSEATTSLLLRAIGVPTARVGYAYVRLNGADYGLYADVETVDAVMAQHWFSGTKHVYEANDPGDVGPGHNGDFQVQEGSSDNLSDLEALGQADAGGPGSWFDRMQAVADLPEIVRAMAAEHYVGQWDGYSVGVLPLEPHNYYLQSDLAGRFSLIPSGTDQAWTFMERSAFGVYGNGVLMRHCAQDAACRALYVDALRQMAGSPALAALPAQARAIRAVIAPWRVLDPRREQSAADGEAQADAKLAVMAGRPAQLAAWLDSPGFADAIPPPRSGGSGPNDLSLTGAAPSASAPLGGSLEWRLHVKNSGGGTVSGVVLDLRLSSNLGYGFGQASRGSGCVATGSSVHCELDWLGPWDDNSSADVIIGTPVTGPGEVTLTALASYARDDPTPDDNALTLKANSGVAVATASQPLTPAPVAARPVLGRPAATPAKPLAGHTFTFTLSVTRSDTGKPLTAGTLECDPRIGGKLLRHAESFKAGIVRMSFLVPKTAQGKQLKVAVQITALGQSAGHTYSFLVR